MIHDLTARFADVVTTYNKTVIVVMLVLTAGVAFGIVQDEGEASQDIDDDALGETDVAEALEYIEVHYTDDEEAENLTIADVYVISENENVLTSEAFRTAIAYQQAALDEPAVGDALVEEGVTGVPNIVGTKLAGDHDPDLDDQYAAIADANDDELELVVAETFDGSEETSYFLPTTYEAGSAEADAFRMSFTFDAEADGFSHQEALLSLSDTAEEHESTTVFVHGTPAYADLQEQLLADAAWLVIPGMLVVLLIILGFAYRDVTDVVIGFTGTVFALLWAAGLMGWMGLLNQQTAIIVPILVGALSIDFGFHVFMRYREYRGPEDGIRQAFSRSTGAVSVAFLLVTVTAAIGFLSNQVSPVALIRDLGVAISLGVVGALIIFTTFVPALKVSADGLWERYGFDRRQTALGKGQHLSRVLGTGAMVARRSALAVIAVALLAGVAGGLAFAELDREAWQEQDFTQEPGWQADLPGPMAFDAHESDVATNLAFVSSNFQSDQDSLAEGGVGFTTMLVEDEDGVATPEAMATIAAGHEATADVNSEIVLRQGDEIAINSPLALMEQVAAHNEEFDAMVADADTTNDGVPDRNVEALFDELFELTPEQAALVIERADDGEYESMLLNVPVQQGAGSERADVMYGIADEMADEAGHEVTPVGAGTINDAEMSEIAEGIVSALLIAMAGVLVALAVVYRVVHGSLTLGVVTVVPIALALGLVFGGMYLLGQPLTLVTALLVSITIGLGIDYNIHVSDRFIQELERGHDVVTALREAVTGTGGALLGSALTSGGAFSLLVLVPEAQLTSFGTIVALALGVSFVLSVFVLPSLLWLWARYTHEMSVSTDVLDVATDD